MCVCVYILFYFLTDDKRADDEDFGNALVAGKLEEEVVSVVVFVHLYL